MEGKDLKNKVMDEQGKSRATVRVVLNDKLLFLFIGGRDFGFFS